MKGEFRTRVRIAPVQHAARPVGVRDPGCAMRKSDAHDIRVLVCAIRAVVLYGLGKPIRIRTSEVQNRSESELRKSNPNPGLVKKV